MTTRKLDYDGLDSEGYVSIRWHIDDVHEVYKGLTDEQAAQVLVFVERKHDANYGVTWETLEYAAVHLFGEENVNA